MNTGVQSSVPQSKETAVVHYDTKKQVRLDGHASPSGLGAVISQRG